MNNSFFNFILKFGLFVVAYIVAIQYLDDQYILYITVVLSFVYILSRVLNKKDPLSELTHYCNASNFIRLSEKVFKKDETKRFVYVAYGKLYEGDLSESAKYLKKLDVDVLKEDQELYHMYLQTLLRHEYEEGHKDQIEEIFNIVQGDSLIHPNTKQIAKIMIFIIEKKYQEALDVLLKAIPKESRKHVIMELEMILGEVYVKLDQKEDAKAVLEFVASRKYHTIHIEKAKSMLVNLS